MNGKWLTLGLAAIFGAVVGWMRNSFGIALLMLMFVFCLGYFKEDYLQMRREDAARQAEKDKRQEEIDKELRAEKKAEEARRKTEQEFRAAAAKVKADEAAKEQKRLEWIAKKKAELEAKAARCDTPTLWTGPMKYHGKLRFTVAVNLNDGMPQSAIIENLESFPSIPATEEIQLGAVVHNSIPKWTCYGTGTFRYVYMFNL